jgi:hypothetical protein
MFAQVAKAGTPALSIKWPKGTVISANVQKNEDGRFLCRVKVNGGEFFSLPGTHPTEADALMTLQAYIAENMYQGETKDSSEIKT